MSRNSLLGRLALAAACLVCHLGLSAPGTSLPLALTQENVQKKAVVVRQGAKLYARAQGEDGKPAPFMQLYFLLEGESSGRAPVTHTPNKTEPDGWLTKEAFAEWNSIQMINFLPQSGRELARIYDNAGCAESFGQSGVASGTCTEFGSEPQRTGKQKDNYSLLVPVVGRDRDNFQGGFVRVSAEGPVVKPVTDREVTKAAAGSGTLGYDLVLAVDATASMQTWFKPTTEALDGFIQGIKQRSGGEIAAPFRVGLLFYRDRKLLPDCDIEYLFRWEAELTDDIAAVSRALANAKEAQCGSDEAAESVYDALSRAVQDPKWKDGYFKVVLLIGDSPPHPPSNKDKNPLGFDAAAVTQLSAERNVRILAFKIGETDETEFKQLAEGSQASVQGRFRAIPPDSSAYKSALLTALNEEWGIVTHRKVLVDAGVTQGQATADPNKVKQLVPGVSDHDLPVIIANLPPGSPGGGAPEYVAGWVPQKIKGQAAFGEFLFLGKTQLQNFANIIESIALAASDGVADGSDAFIRSLRNSLAQSLGMQPDDVFRSGESLDSMLEKAKVLPFKTTVLAFTAEEVNAWKPTEYERLNKILQEKATHLREFSQKPGNARMFGDKPHLYVPKDLFP
jgi:hypothetical protein